MSASTTPATPVVITVPLSLKREQPKVTHFHEARAKGDAGGHSGRSDLAE